MRSLEDGKENGGSIPSWIWPAYVTSITLVTFSGTKNRIRTSQRTRLLPDHVCQLMQQLSIEGLGLVPFVRVATLLVNVKHLI